MGNIIKAIIIDDENNCIANLKYYLATLCPDIQVIAEGNTIEKAMQIFNTCVFDVAFLDVEIFDNNIFNVLEYTHAQKFKIVFVTAHERYAIKAIKNAALDYILKPLSRQDVLECYTRIKQRDLQKDTDKVTTGTSNITQAENGERKIILKEGDKIFIVKVDDIYYLQAKGAYTLAAFNLNDTPKCVTISKALNQVEKENNSKKLYRVHKSYLINVHKIKGIIKQDRLAIQMGNNEIIPIAKRRAQDFLSYLNNMD